MTFMKFLATIGVAVAVLSANAPPAHADLPELDRETAKQILADSTGVVLVDVYAYW